jgi:hypothetical protein
MTEFFTAGPSIGCLTELIFLHRQIFNEAVMFRKVAVLPSGVGVRGDIVVTALHYKPAGRGLIPDGVIGIFQ